MMMVMLVVTLTVWRFFPQKKFVPGLAPGRQAESQEIVFSHTGVTHRSFYAQKHLHREVFTQSYFTHKRFYTQKFLHKKAFTQRSFYPQKLLHREVSTQSRGKENSHFTSRLCFRYTRSPQRFAPAQTMQIRVGDARSPQRVTFLISFDGRGLAASAAKREKFRKTWEAGVL